MNDMEDNRRATCVDAPVDFGEDTQCAGSRIVCRCTARREFRPPYGGFFTLVRTENQLLLEREWAPLGLEKERS